MQQVAVRKVAPVRKRSLASCRCKQIGPSTASHLCINLLSAGEAKPASDISEAHHPKPGPGSPDRHAAGSNQTQ
eukprot:scaffold20664_cov22-Tisochrysis_lutea.AAC.2